jgi:acyl dehydratase
MTEPLSAGTVLPTISRTPGTEDLVRFGQGANDVARLHYDQDYARSRGFPTVIVHGALKATLMAQVLTDWVGLRGWVSDFRAEYRAPDPVGATLVAHGVIRDVERPADADTPVRVHVDLWVENDSGARTCVGTGTVVLDPTPLYISPP